MKRKWIGRIYLGQRADGTQDYKWVGRYETRKERDAAVARARVDLERERQHESLTIGEWSVTFLARYERTRKSSSFDTARQALKPFVAEHGHRPIRSFKRFEAIQHVEAGKPGAGVLVTFFREAEDAELIDRNPFRGLGPKTKGRSDEHPPTLEEFDRLAEACSVMGDYAPQMRSLLLFAAYSGMRPSELYALEWEDIDFDTKRIRKDRRVYRGSIDVPKTGRKTIALTPPARDALLPLDSRLEGGLVFRSIRGRRLSQSTMSGYWGKVQAKAGLDFDFYLATKHYCVNYMWTELNAPTRAIAAQMGWEESTVIEMLKIYGHGDIGALSEVDAAFASGKVRHLREAK